MAPALNLMFNIVRFITVRFITVRFITVRFITFRFITDFRFVTVSYFSLSQLFLLFQ
jgi:hypothetical protein